MKKLEITEDGKVLYSFEAPDFTVEQTRDCTPLFKTGETSPFTIAPSRRVKIKVTGEMISMPSAIEFYTDK